MNELINKRNTGLNIKMNVWIKQFVTLNEIECMHKCINEWMNGCCGSKNSGVLCSSWGGGIWRAGVGGQADFVTSSCNHRQCRIRNCQVSQHFVTILSWFVAVFFNLFLKWIPFDCSWNQWTEPEICPGRYLWGTKGWAEIQGRRPRAGNRFLEPRHLG